MTPPSLPQGCAKYHLHAQLVSVRFHDAERAFVVADALVEGSQTTVVGDLPVTRKGSNLLISGEWQEHPWFGRQLLVHEAELANPSEDELIELLCSLPAIGKLRAQRVIEAHGCSTLLSQLDRDPRSVLLATGLRGSALERACAQWTSDRSIRALRSQLRVLGAGHLASAIFRRWGQEASGIVRDDPWRLVVDYPIAFSEVQAIAPDCLGGHRAHAALCHAMREVEEREGHTTLMVDELLERAVKLDGGVDEVALEGCIRLGALTVSDQWVARRETSRQERYLAGQLTSLSRSMTTFSAVPEFLFESSLNIAQTGAIVTVLSRGVTVITGGPGTGKTRMLRELVHCAEDLGWSVAACAPTGKAARRLGMAIDRPASTAHALLEYSRLGVPGRTDENPLPHELVIVDEVSMLDQDLAAALVAAIRPGSHLVLIGDPDQLPSVGAGRVLHDVIASEAFPVARLSHVYRQRQDSQILDAAERINGGSAPSDEQTGQEVFLIPEGDSHRLADRVVDLALREIPERFDLSPQHDLLVMSPTRQGPAGTVALCERFAAAFGPDRPELAPGLFAGDRLIWTENDRELGLFNGTILHLAERHGDLLLLHDEDGEAVFVPLRRCDALYPAWCLTVHRAQGSQAPVVLLALDSGRTNENLLTRQMLYTAVTRAQQAVFVVGELGLLGEMAARDGAHLRKTRLTELLRAAGRRIL